VATVAGDDLRPQKDVGCRRWSVADELRPLTHFVRELDRGAIDPYAAVAREALDRAPRQKAVVRQELVDALPTGVDAQRDRVGHAARAAVFRSSCQSSRVTQRMPSTMDESA